MVMPGPVLAGSGEFVGEDPFAAGGGQRVVLSLEGLVVGETRAYPMTAIPVSVAELGMLAGYGAPGFGPSSATIRNPADTVRACLSWCRRRAK